MRSAAMPPRLRPLSGVLVALLAGCSGPALPGDDAVDGPAGDGMAGDDGGPDAPPRRVQVCASGGADHATIGAAIDAANAGDTIEVCAGTYRERLVITGKPLHLLGPAGAAATIIDAGAGGTGVAIRDTGAPGVTLEGFTIRNGLGAAEGGGLRCERSTVALQDSALVGNRGAGGGGLFATACALDLHGTHVEDNDGDRTGGGALVIDSSATVRASVFVGNRGVNGAGLAVYDSSLTLEDNELRANLAGLRGGGLYLASEGTIAGNRFLDNSAGWTGGAIHTVGHAPVLVDNLVRGSSSVNDGGGVYVHQGTATLRGNQFLDNYSGDDGGAVKIFEGRCLMEANLFEGNRARDAGGAVRISHEPCEVIDNIARNNTAGGPGGAYDLDNDASTMRGGEITGNVAGGAGGGIHAYLAPWTGTTIEDVLIADNRAWRGGGLFIVDNFKPVAMRRLVVVDNRAGYGGGLGVRSTNFTVSHSLFARNQANAGGGVHHEVARPWNDECPCPPAAPTGQIRFSVFHDNQAGAGAALWTNAAGLTVDNSILFAHQGTTVTVAPDPETPEVLNAPIWRYNDTFPATFEGMPVPVGNNGNLAMDPLFVDPAVGDYQLRGDSPCRNAGDPALRDADGGRASMGMFGGTP
jgi:hypothetical protein